MKTNCWLVLGTMMATSALAQVSTNRVLEIPAPALAPTVAAVAATNHTTIAPKKKAPPTAHKKKPIAKAPVKAAVKKTADLPVTLVPGPATVAVENLNLRGQAGLKGEVVGHAKKGDTVTVLAEINLDKHKADEPAQWAKVSLPSGTKVWVNTHFIDATNKVVSAKKLNLRGGPGENFSVLGNLEKGAAVAPISSKGDWTQIEAPVSAFAFVAASYLKQEPQAVTPTNPAPPVVAVVTPPVPPTPTTVVEPPAVVPVPVVTPVIPDAPVTPAVVNPPVVPAVPVVPAPEVLDTNPPPPRIVTHEGYVRHSVSLVAPTYFELYDATTSNAIDYLYTTTTNLNLARYNGLKIIVTGEEGLDARWHDTPVLTIQKILVVPEEHAPVESKRVSSPRGSQRH